tara:strand:- start:144 stop:380 length:237 start_codon:yes stop_codon:yes gene_type:complete
MFANIYDNKEDLIKSLDKYKTFPLRLFKLIPTNKDKFDLCVIKVQGKYIAALGAKEKIENDNLFTKCIKKEIYVKDLR